jgi:hypothetical protein
MPCGGFCISSHIATIGESIRYSIENTGKRMQQVNFCRPPEQRYNSSFSYTYKHSLFRLSLPTSAKVSHVSLICKEIGPEESLSVNEAKYTASPPSRLRIYTIILLITTAMSGLLLIYLFLKPETICTATKSPSEFQYGYDAEYGNGPRFHVVNTLTEVTSSLVEEAIHMQKVTYTSVFRYHATPVCVKHHY